MRTVSLLAVTLCAVLVSASTSDISLAEPANLLSLEGSVFPSGRPCLDRNGSNCDIVPPVGPNVTIWHGDGTCSTLILHCALNSMSVTLLSPGHIPEAYVTWQGATAPSSAARPLSCTGRRASGVQSYHQITSSPMASYVNQECGTEVKQIGADVFMENVVNVLELVHVNLDQIDAPSVFLLSHTQVAVKCCRETLQDPIPCQTVHVKKVTDAPEPYLGDCDQRNFELECSANSKIEAYECKVKLNDGEVLGDPRLKFSIHSCNASSDSNPDTVVPLITADTVNGPVSNVDLEVSNVCVANSDAGADRAVYHFSIPFLQFDGQDPLMEHSVAITCSVTVYEVAVNPLINEPACY